MSDTETADAIHESFVSEVFVNRLGNPSNMNDVVRELSGSVEKIARAIVPDNALPGHDAAGGTICSLTESVMGVTAGLYAIASAISDLAEAIRDQS